jgi:hypothetical protein
MVLGGGSCLRARYPCKAFTVKHSVCSTEATSSMGFKVQGLDDHVFENQVTRDGGVPSGNGPEGSSRNTLTLT